MANKTRKLQALAIYSMSLIVKIDLKNIGVSTKINHYNIINNDVVFIVTVTDADLCEYSLVFNINDSYDKQHEAIINLLIAIELDNFDACVNSMVEGEQSINGVTND